MYAAVTAPHDKEARFRDQDKRLQESATRRVMKAPTPITSRPSTTMPEHAVATHAAMIKHLPAALFE